MSAQSKSVYSVEENEEVKGLPKPKYVIDGVPFTLRTADNYMEAVKKIRTLEYRPTDILVSGYSRTGTTWTLAIVWLILHDADVQTFKEMPQSKRVCRMDLVHDGEETNLSRLDRGMYDDPRILMAHLPYEWLAPNFKKAGNKVIYTLRNPKDTIVSMYHASRTFKKDHVADLVDKEPDFGTVLQYACSIADHGPILQSIKSWWQNRDNPNIFFTFYEDKIRNPRKAVRDLATFLEKDLSEEQIDAILEVTKIATMKTTYASYNKEGFHLPFNTKDGIRKGEIGQWKHQFTVEQNEWLDAQIEKHLGGLDLNFQYD